MAYGELDDGALVQATLDGDVRAEEVLFKRHVPAVHVIARRMLRDPNEADDVVQDSFALAHERLTKLREPSAFRGWLMQIAVRLVHRRFRRRKMLAMLGFVAMPDHEPCLVEEARADLGPEARLDLRRIDVALGQVAEADRMAWLLRHVDGLALEDVAAACDCSLATVKRRLSRAQERVRAVLGYELEGGRDES